MFLGDNTEDRQYLERIRNNDRSVLSEIFRRYEPLVVGYIKKHGGSRQDGYDMLQEAVIVFWEKAVDKNFSLTVKAGTYILAIAKNKWRENRRKAKRMDPQSGIPERAAAEDNTLDDLISREQTQLIATALHTLSETCRQILLLYYYEQRSMREIAGLLALANENVVKARKYQCKKMLQEILEKHKIFSGGTL